MSLALLSLALLVASDICEVIFAVFLAAVLNHILLIFIFSLAFKRKKVKGSLVILGLFFIKLFLLSIAFYWGVQLVGDRIIIPLILYTLQLVALGVGIILRK